jgi:hypothetical protein
MKPHSRMDTDKTCQLTGTVRGPARSSHFSLAIISVTVQLWTKVFWVISVYFYIRNTLPKSGTFLLGHLYICCTTPLTSRCCILYISSTNIHTEYFKHAARSPFFPLQNAVYFIMQPFLVPVLFTF